MSVTFVTALIDLHEERLGEKTFDRYVALLHQLQSSGMRLHVFASSNLYDRIHVLNGVVERMELEDLESYRHCPPGLPDERNINKDTRNYLILMNAKTELVTRAIQSGHHAISHYAWIDVGICHVLRTPDATLSNLMSVELPAKCLYIPGCRERSPRVSPDSIHWRFCGGFFVGDIASLIDFHEKHRALFAVLTKLTWEVNVWALLEQMGWTPTWYASDHNDTILNVPVRKHIVRYPHYVDVYWYGELSKCYPRGAIESYVASSIQRQSTTASVAIVQTDGIDMARYMAVRQAHPKSIVATLCSRETALRDVLLLPLDDETFQKGLSETLSHYTRVNWNQKIPRVFWRGSTTGVEEITPRMRVVDALVSHPHCDVRFTHGVSFPSDARIDPHKFAPHRVSIGEHFQYKYILIVDGNVIASSHQWVFGSGSVPVMVTHPDNRYWFQPFLQPMKNYVPIAYDLSDLEEKVEWLVTHDEEAQQIANNAMYLSSVLFSPEFQKAYIDVRIREILGMKRTIGVAIPCYRPHISKLKECLDSIEAQTVRPDHVVVVCSSSSPNDIPTDWKYSFPLDIVCRSDQRNAAQNRNEAWPLLGTEYISFFDADDVMHPQRIECLKRCDADIVLHAFSEDQSQPFRIEPTYLHGVLVRAPSGCADCTRAYGCRIHHAHATVRREILTRIQYREEPDYERREDSVFCGDVLALPGIKNTYIPQPLSLYRPQRYTIDLTPSPST